MSSKIQIDPRDRLGFLVAGLAITIVLAGLLFVPAGPLKNYRASQAEVESLEQDMLLAQAMRWDEQQRIESQKWIAEGLEQRGSGFNLLTFLNEVLAQNGLRDRVSLQNQAPPRGVENVSLVYLDAKGISLKELLDLLHAIYSSGKLIVVYNMNYAGPAPDGNGLDCRVTFLTING